MLRAPSRSAARPPSSAALLAAEDRTGRWGTEGGGDEGGEGEKKGGKVP